VGLCFDTTRRPRLLAAGVLLPACLAIVAPAANSVSTGEPTPIADIKALTEAEANEGRVVHVRGVVTWYDDKSFAVQDDTGGIWLTQEFARREGVIPPDAPSFSARLEPGMLVDVEGVTTHAELYSVMLMPRAVTVVGRKPLPPALPSTHGALFSGGTDHLRVEVRGVVQGFRNVEGSPWCLLFVDAEPGEVGVLAPKAAFDPDPSALIDAEVQVRGVCGACFNYRGEFLSPRIHVNGRDDLDIISPAPSPPFAAPLIRIDDLAGYHAAEGGNHRKRIEGVVTFVKPGECFYIQEGTTGVRIETRSTAPLHVGDRVEVAGFPTMARRIAGLKEAVVNPLKVETPPEPVAKSLAKISSRAGAADGLLVTLPARLLEAQSVADGVQLALAAGSGGFTATLHGPHAADLLTLVPGSELAVTGVVQTELQYDYRVRPSIERVGLLLRSAGDVVVVRPASWWTPRRLFQAMAALVAVLTASLVWVLLLRRQVSLQSGRLAGEMRKRRDSAVEFEATLRERNRLAANLHDTLLQTLGGIGYQLEACEMSGIDDAGETRRHFEVAQRMVDHAMGQLHDSVWTLRSLPLRNQTFPDALRAMARRIAEGHDVAIDVHTSGTLANVPDFVAGNLLLVIQEGIHNAIRHGRPQAITIEVQTDEATSRIEVKVRDDGAGFVPGTQQGVAQGHFGIEGMRERVERLDGRLWIESAPGEGTVLRASVSRHAYDSLIA
jgi:signal transduction histidine kinase